MTDYFYKIIIILSLLNTEEHNIFYPLSLQAQQRTLTQYDMLPRHQVNVRKLTSECF